MHICIFAVRSSDINIINTKQSKDITVLLLCVELCSISMNAIDCEILI